MTKKQLILGMLTLAAVAALAACARKPGPLVAEPPGHWISLFNGKDLSDWTPKIAGLAVNDNYRDTFRVENGLLSVSYSKYDKFDGKFGSLYSKQKFSHYWLRAEYRFVGSLLSGAPSWAYKNSGLQLHSQAPETMRQDQEFPVSVELDIKGGHFIGSRPTGDVCQNGTHVLINGAPLKDYCSTVGDITIRGEEWTTVLAEVDGSKHVRHIVNGELVVDYTDLTLDESNADARRLIAAGADKSLSSGYISIQSNGAPIEFRRIEVLPIDDAGAASSAAPASNAN
jgi:hypothetical protein